MTIAALQHQATCPAHAIDCGRRTKAHNLMMLEPVRIRVLQPSNSFKKS
jgi:hypothetical protein